MHSQWSIYSNYCTITGVVQDNCSIDGGNLRNVGYNNLSRKKDSDLCGQGLEMREPSPIALEVQRNQINFISALALSFLAMDC